MKVELEEIRTKERLTLLGPQSRFADKTYVDFNWFVPLTGTAVLENN